MIAARKGRAAAQTPEARAKQGDKQQQQRQAEASWSLSDLPEWLTPELYANEIQIRLASISNGIIASRIGVSRWYAGRIRKGYRPHPRHWPALAELAEVKSAR